MTTVYDDPMHDYLDEDLVLSPACADHDCGVCDLRDCEHHCHETRAVERASVRGEYL